MKNTIISGSPRLSKAALLLTAMSLSTPVWAQEGSNSGTVQDIVVTAQKREQRLQDVPISISAFSAAAVEAQRIHTVQDLDALAPNLLVRETPGTAGAPSFTIRGVTGGGLVAGTDVGVSLYVDGVYLGSTYGSIFDLADTDRIEVLKGPQGTLFGRNSTGGAVSILTSNPAGAFHVKQDVTVGNYAQFRSKTRVDLPAVGPFSASITYLHDQRHGDIRNLQPGVQWNYGPATNGRFGIETSPERFGDRNTNAVAAALRFKPSDDFDMIYKFDYTYTSSTPTGNSPVILGDPASGAGVVAGILASQPPGNAALMSQFTTQRPDAVNGWFAAPGYMKNYGHNLTSSYHVNSMLSFKDILAYRDVNSVTIPEQDGLGGLVTPGFFGPAVAGSPFIVFAAPSQFNTNQFSNEFQMYLTARRFKLTSGFLYFTSTADSGPMPGAPSILVFSPLPNYVVPGSPTVPTHVDARSIAVFSQAEYNLTDSLTAVGGIRETWDRKTGTDNSNVATPIPIDYKTAKLTWLAGVNYKPSKDALLYAKVSTGFIAGGSFGGHKYLPESALSYEAGVKADSFDRRLRTNLSLFYVDYTDQQFLLFSGGVLSMYNAGKARAWGGEFESTLVPVKGLTLTAGLGYTNFKYTYLDPSIGTLSTFFPVNRPKWTSTLSAQYETPTYSWGGKLVFRADTNYKSAMLMINAPISDAERAAMTAPPTWIVNGRLALVDIPVSGAKAEVALWARNLTNNRALASGADLGFLETATFEPARTFGVDLNFKY